MYGMKPAVHADDAIAAVVSHFTAQGYEHAALRVAQGFQSTMRRATQLALTSQNYPTATHIHEAAIQAIGCGIDYPGSLAHFIAIAHISQHDDLAAAQVVRTTTSLADHARALPWSALGRFDTFEQTWDMNSRVTTWLYSQTDSACVAFARHLTSRTISPIVVYHLACRLLAARNQAHGSTLSGLLATLAPDVQDPTLRHDIVLAISQDVHLTSFGIQRSHVPLACWSHLTDMQQQDEQQSDIRATTLCAIACTSPSHQATLLLASAIQSFGRTNLPMPAKASHWLLQAWQAHPDADTVQAILQLHHQRQSLHLLAPFLPCIHDQWHLDIVAKADDTTLVALAPYLAQIALPVAFSAAHSAQARQALAVRQTVLGDHERAYSSMRQIDASLQGNLWGALLASQSDQPMYLLGACNAARRQPTLVPALLSAGLDEETQNLLLQPVYRLPAQQAVPILTAAVPLLSFDINIRTIQMALSV